MPDEENNFGGSLLLDLENDDPRIIQPCSNQIWNDTAHVNSDRILRISTQDARVSFRECLPKLGRTGQHHTAMEFQKKSGVSL